MFDAYSEKIWVGLESTGFFWPGLLSLQAANVAIAKMTNNKGIKIFMVFFLLSEWKKRLFKIQAEEASRPQVG